MKKLLLSLLFVCLPTVLFAQGNHCFGGMAPGVIGCTDYLIGDENGNTPIPLTFASNIPNAKSMNVWHEINGSPSGLLGVSGGYDSTGQRIFGWTSAMAAWELTDPNHGVWSQNTAMGNSIAKMVLGGGGVIYSLQPNSYCTTNYGAGFYGVYKWSGSAWTNQHSTSCVLNLSEAATDGTLIAIEQNGVPIYSTNQGASWIVVTYNGQGSLQVSDVAMKNVNWGCIVLAPPPHGNYLVECGNPSAGGFVNGFTSFYGLRVAISQAGLFVLDNSNVVEHWQGTCYNNTCWDKFQGPGFSAISSCGSGCTYAMASGIPYRYPDVSMTGTATISGVTTISGGTLSGVTHQLGIGMKFVKTLTGGMSATGPKVAPQNQSSATVHDTTFDPFSCTDSGLDCYTTTPTGGDVDCSVVDEIFAAGLAGGGGSGAIPNGCYSLPSDADPSLGQFSPYQWDTASQVNIYFDGRSTVWGNQPCPVPDYCKVLTGIQSWTYATIDLTSYNNMGPYTGKLCSDPYSNLIPCNPTYPFIFVTQTINQSDSDTLYTTANGQYSVMYISATILGNANYLTSAGAHEEGHNHSLGNCDPNLGTCTATNQGQTVMWYQNITGRPLMPTTCDILNSAAIQLHVPLQLLP